jgi:N-acetylneuraminate synthase/N,N'-diacetyllegionaminate synthase
MTESEAKNLVGIRRSIVATKDIPKGTQLSHEMLGCKRPGSGMPPEDMVNILGLTVTSNILADELIKWGHFKNG